MKRITWFICLWLCCTLTAVAQEANSVDTELERIKTLSKQAWDEAEQFRQAGHKDDDPNYPGRKWAVTFWQYRLAHPGTPAAARATSEALHFLVHAGLLAEFEAKTDSLKADDAAWKDLTGTLNEAAERKKDNAYFLRKVQWLDQQAPDKEVKVRARFMQAQSLWQKGDIVQAKALFQSVRADFPGTPQAQRAEGNLAEIEFLNVGQPAPLFAGKTTAGAPLRLADLKGQVVLLEFWASWCGSCLKEMPTVKELHAKYQTQGLSIIGISLDDDAQALQQAITSNAIPWPHLRDGKAGALGKLFNVSGTPAFFLLDRQGRIAARADSVSQVAPLLPNLLRTETTGANNRERKAREMLQLLGVRAGQVVADIGAGPGFFTRRFAEAVGPTGKAIGLDIDPAAIRTMTVDAQRSGLKQYEARLVPPDDPLLPPQSVDIIFLSDTLHHIENRVPYFTRLRAAFKPEGRLVIIDFGGSGEHAITKAATLQTMQEAGYKLVKEHGLLLPEQFFLEFVVAQR